MAGGAHEGLEHLLYEVKKIVVGQDHFLDDVCLVGIEVERLVGQGS